MSKDDFELMNDPEVKRGKKSANLTSLYANKYELSRMEMSAKEIIDSLKTFSFEQFESIFSRKPGDATRVSFQYARKIRELKIEERLNTLDTYISGEKNIVEFVKKKKTYSYENLTFYDITAKWLEEFEKYLIEDKGKSITTLAIYLRAFKTLFNEAINQNAIEADIYPFGRNKYQIPSINVAKRALSMENLKKFFELQPKQVEHEKAKDFWFMSYACNGANIKDLALLKFSDIDDDKITFLRAKTKKTSKTNLKPIVVFRNDYIDYIFCKYGNKRIHDDQYVFNILTSGLSAAEIKTRIKAFTRFLNQHTQNLCKQNDLPRELTTYWARHSFTTIAIRKGASMEFIQESLGHSNITTTQNYFAGFEDSKRKDFASSLMDF